MSELAKNCPAAVFIQSRERESWLRRSLPILFLFAILSQDMSLRVSPRSAGQKAEPMLLHHASFINIRWWPDFTVGLELPQRAIQRHRRTKNNTRSNQCHRATEAVLSLLVSVAAFKPGLFREMKLNGEWTEWSFSVLFRSIHFSHQWPWPPFKGGPGIPLDRTLDTKVFRRWEIR